MADLIHATCAGCNTIISASSPDATEWVGMNVVAERGTVYTVTCPDGSFHRPRRDQLTIHAGPLPVSGTGWQYSTSLTPAMARIPHPAGKWKDSAGGSASLAALVPDDVTILPGRIGDKARDEASTAIGEFYASGHISREEFDARLAHVQAARTGQELKVLLSDLPGGRLGPEQGPRILPPGPDRRLAQAKKLIGAAHWTALLGVIIVFIALSSGAGEGFITAFGNLLFFGSILVMFTLGVAGGVRRRELEQFRRDLEKITGRHI